MSIELDEAREEFRILIVGTCNTIGCDKCPFKWDGDCRSNELQSRVMDLEDKEG